jgi:hypothetical protein
MNSNEVLNKLKEPFDPFDIEWRIQSAGKSRTGKLWAILVPYVDNRAIQNRLDEVCGVDGWKNEFTYPSDKAVLCGISIKFGVTSPEWITKWDGAGETSIEAVKGGVSNAMKRAAVQWGIGRYLYRLEAAIITPLDKQPPDMADYLMARSVTIEGKKTNLYYKRPKLPVWALPKAEGEDEPA